MITMQDIQVLEDEEIQDIILCFLKTRGQTKRATKEEIDFLVKWAKATRFQSMMLEMILENRVSVDISDGNIVFGVRENGDGVST